MPRTCRIRLLARLSVLLLAVVAGGTQRNAICQESTPDKVIENTTSGDPVTDAESDQKKLKASLAKWKKARKQCRGDYSYTVRFTSFAGFGHETDVIVRNHKVVERRFRLLNGQPVDVGPNPEKPNRKPTGGKWAEKGENLGTHKNGAPAKTLDELYVEALKVVSRGRDEHERFYLRFNKQGLLLECFTVDTRIADDAPRKGVNLSSLTLSKEHDAKTSTGKKKTGKVYTSPNGKSFPASWGAPPLRQTRDLRPLPGGYGRGSSTLAKWIQGNLDGDANPKKKQ